MSLSSFSGLANDLANESARIIEPLFRTTLSIDQKDDLTPVTKADRDAESAMRDMIRKAFPDHGIIGEEFGRESDDAEYVWVLDPVDGTAALISGIPTFGTLIALCRRGMPILGVISQPISGERWIGLKGETTTLNGHPVAVRAQRSLENCTLFTTSPELFKTDEEKAAFDRLRLSTLLRRYGCDCYGYGLLASGFADIVCETDLKVYDYMALVPVVTGAGGVMTDWENTPLHLASGPQVLASTGQGLHRQALDRLAGDFSTP